MSLRVSNNDDLREDLELAVMELQDRGVAARSIRRFINDALRAEVDKEGVRSTSFLRKHWRREQDPGTADAA